MYIPHSDRGYNLINVDTSDLSMYHSKLLFQHHSSKYHYLVDRLVSYLPELQEIFKFISGISDTWVKRLKGQMLNHFMRVLIVYLDNRYQYGFYGNYVVASSYSKLKHHIQKQIKVLIIKYGLPNKYYKLYIPKDRLLKLSELFANDLLPLMEKLLPKYRKLIQNN